MVNVDHERLRSFREFEAPQLLSTAFASWQRYCTAYSSGRQPNFAALNTGRHLCLAGLPSGWALAHILVFGTERSSILCDFDARQSRALKTRDKIAGVTSVLGTRTTGMEIVILSPQCSYSLL